VKEVEKRLRKIEQELGYDIGIIENVTMLENGLFMYTAIPLHYEGEIFELPAIAVPGSNMEQRCREIYQESKEARN